MKIDVLQDATLEAMGSYLTRLSKRHQIIASNIANIDTPRYKTKDISFHATIGELLASPSIGLKTSQPEHQPKTEWSFVPMDFEVAGLPVRADHNNVDIDKEMLKLGETSFGYSMVSQLLRLKFRTVASSINEGRVG